MTRRGLLALPWVANLRADSAEDAHALITAAANALSKGKAAAFWAAFDSKMPVYRELRRDSEALLLGAGVQSTIEFLKNEGDEGSRSVELDWLLEISQTLGIPGTTERRQRVQCRVEKRGAEWHIVSFAPAGFFAPAPVAEAWQLVSAAAGALGDANATSFLNAFDPAMEAFETLRGAINAMVRNTQVETTVDLLKNDGTDLLRNLELDWSLNLLAPDSGISAVRRRETVTCRVEKQGKRWRITAVKPLAFFTAPRA